MRKTVKLTTGQKIKNFIWHKIYFVFPKLQKILLDSHIVWHEKGRQKYHLGWLAANRTLKELENHLHKKYGFGNHFVAWADDGQVLSWRKLVDFEHQYHIRVFADGEIRGHYEYTPESKPIDHFTEVDEEARIKEFHKFLDGYVVYEKGAKHAHDLKPDVETAPESEITIDSVAK